MYLHMVKKYAGGKVLMTKPARPADKPAPAPEPADKPVEPAEPTPTDTAPADPDKPANKPVKPKPADKPAGPTIDGKPLYDKSCKACHAADGKGTAGMKANNIPDFTDGAWQKSHGKAKVAAAIANGVDGTKMKAFKDKLSADEIAAVAAYVKKLK